MLNVLYMWVIYLPLHTDHYIFIIRMPVVILPIILENTISFKYILFIASIIKLTYLFRYMTALHPTIKWAQRKDKIFVTLGIRDI